MKNIDYSQIFSKYEVDPLRQKKIENILIKKLKQHRSQESTFKIIDIGCGSGSWLKANFNNLANYKNIKWFGVDKSEEMLSLAINKISNIKWIQASADALPLPSDYFNFAITEYTYHHFENKGASFKEIYRLINKKGVLMIRNIEPWKMQDWSLYYFFPEARNADQKRFLKPEILKTILKNIGFKEIETKFQIINGNLYETADEWFKIIKNRTHSQLRIINDKEYQNGIKRISELILNKRKELEEFLSNDISAIIEVNAIK
jgi:ubiquinone/menaquinone biosynthesis C-methylase UbiE